MHRSRGHTIRPLHALQTSDRDDAGSVWIKRLYERGEEAVGVFVEEFIGNKRVREELGRPRTGGRREEARRQRMQTVLSLLNLPSRADLNRLQTKIEALQGSMVNLSIKLDRLLAAQQDEAKRHAQADRRLQRPRGNAHKKTAHPAS